MVNVSRDHLPRPIPFGSVPACCSGPSTNLEPRPRRRSFALALGASWQFPRVIHSPLARVGAGSVRACVRACVCACVLAWVGGCGVRVCGVCVWCVCVFVTLRLPLLGLFGGRQKANVPSVLGQLRMALSCIGIFGTNPGPSRSRKRPFLCACTKLVFPKS